MSDLGKLLRDKLEAKTLTAPPGGGGGGGNVTWSNPLGHSNDINPMTPLGAIIQEARDMIGQIDYILPDCFLAMGQAVGTDKMLDFDTVVWLRRRMCVPVMMVIVMRVIMMMAMTGMVMTVVMIVIA